MTVSPGAGRRLIDRALAAASAAGAQGPPPIARRPPGTPAPLSPEQRHVWLHAALAPDQPLYNEPCTIVRRGPLDHVALQRALDEIIRRHEIWRTGFDVVDGEVVQQVWDDVRAPLWVTDLRHLPPTEAQSEGLRLATEDAHEPFDLAQPPLLRARLVTLGPDDHRLHLTIHHLILDGVTVTRVLVPELLALYDAYAAGLEAELPPPPLQYGDFAAWRTEQVQTPEVLSQLDYWRGQLAGMAELQLPTDRPRGRSPAPRAGMEVFALSPELSQRLKHVGERGGATLYMMLVAALTALLHRYTGQQDVVIGGLTDTRRRLELQSVMGYFLNSLALRVRPEPDQSFAAHLAGARTTVLQALAAADVPFDQVVQGQQPRREPGRHPLFQVMLVLEPEMSFPPGWDVRQTDVTMNAAKFDLYLEFEDRAEGIGCRILYNSELFEADTVRRMARRLRLLLAAVATDPEIRLADIRLVEGEEMRELVELGRGPVRLDPAPLLPDAFAAQALRRPDAVAVQAGRSSWTYRELDRRADQIAARLRAAGVGPERLVGVCMDRSADLVAALLAVGRSRGAYLPLDPGFPAERLAMIVEDARPAAILTRTELRGALPPLDAPTVLCDELGQELIGAPAPVAAGPDDLAYVIYTSGSTGRPKGVEITHGALANFLRSMLRAPGFAASDSLLAVTTLSFDIAALELFLPLVAGGRVVLADRETAVDPDRLARLIGESGCSVMQATPATWRGLVDAGWTGGQGLRILCGGEAMTRELATALLSRCGELWNVYGPTETTIWSTAERVEHGHGRVPIGRPIDNATAYVLDAEGRLAPRGVCGELHLGGFGLARGYRGREDLTRERFVTARGVPGERLYRTGDQARWRADGKLECLGRLDNQVKVRGFRIELEEVEAALAAHPQVTAAAAQVFPDPAGESRLIGYVTAAGAAPAPIELRSFLRRTLPDYMIPSQFEVLAELPMTPNLKVDRKALLPPQAERPERTLVAPSTPLEAELAAMWEEVLKTSPIGVDDNFFDLGGHSLLVAKLFRMITARFGRRLGMAAIFDAPDVRSLAGLLEQGRAEPTAIKIQPHGSRPPLLWLDAGPTFMPLAEALGPDQPFLGINLEDEDERALGPEFTLEQAADRLAERILAARPSGPYYLGGYCNWGVVSHCVAKRLIARGREPPLLLLLAHAPYPGVNHYSQFRIELSKLKQHASEMTRLGGRAAMGYAGRRGANAARRYTGWLLGKGLPAPENPFRRRLNEATKAYDPGRYPGAVILAQPRERPHVMEYAPAWAAVIDGGFEEHEVPGDHVTMLAAPNVARLGEVFGAALHDAQAPRVRLAAEG